MPVPLIAAVVCVVTGFPFASVEVVTVEAPFEPFVRSVEEKSCLLSATLPAITRRASITFFLAKGSSVRYCVAFTVVFSDCWRKPSL